MLPLIHRAADELDAYAAQIRELRAHVQHLEALVREVA
jgi:prefoldin subunit 5